MALPALVSLEDFALRLGGISASDEERAQAVLDDASALIRAEAGEDWVDDEDTLENVPEVIVAVTVAVAIRAFRNPDGVRSESIGTYAVTYADTSTAVFLTAGERRTVRRAAGRMTMGSIELEGPYAAEVLTVPVNIGGDEMPWITIGDESL
jgi:hypothetical protein